MTETNEEETRKYDKLNWGGRGKRQVNGYNMERNQKAEHNKTVNSGDEGGGGKEDEKSSRMYGGGEKG